VSPERETLALASIADDPEVGRWLAALEDGRADTLLELRGVTPEMVDWYPDAPMNSIGSLLYHVALVEASWVTEEILGDPEAADLQPLLPWPDREGPGEGGQRHLTRIDGQALEEHVARLAAIRAYVLDKLRPMTNDDFHRIRSLERYDVAPDWALHHIIQHEAEHRAHIAWLRDTYPHR
jgi:uncharacterized damage-inducible protein DinB